MVNFTPGPWVADGIHIKARWSEHRPANPAFPPFWFHAAHFALNNGWGSWEQRKVDALLIAAAPDLYEALKACRLQMLQSNNDSEYAQEANELARAAIAKAEGEASNERLA